MNKPLVFLTVALCLGIITALAFFNFIILGLIMVIIFFVIIFSTLNKAWFFEVFIFFALGFISFFVYFNFNTNSSVLDNVRVLEKTSYYTLGSYKNRRIFFQGDVSGLVLGDKVKIQGEFTKSINYSRGIIGCFNIKKVKSIRKDKLSKVIGFRTKTYSHFSKYLSDKRAAFVMSICFGDTTGLKLTQKEELQRLGVLHAVSVSGFHLAVLYKALETAVGVYPSILLSFFYLIFTGNKSPTSRAFIMIIVLKLSGKLYKKYDALSSLAFSAMLILIFKPFYIFDLGFQLSYLSTISIILFNKRIQRALIALPVWMNKSVSISISSQVLSMPLVALSMKNISLGFILGNVFLLPIFTLIVIIGNLALAFSGIKEIFIFLNFILNILLAATEGAILFLLNICPEMKHFTSIEAYVLFALVIIIILVKKGKNNLKLLPIPLALLLVLQCYSFYPRFIFIDSNKSNSILIKYRWSSVLITNETRHNRIDSIKKEYFVTKIISSVHGDSYFKINKRYNIIIGKIKGEDSKLFLKLIDKDKIILFANRSEIPKIVHNEKTNCDIIVLKESVNKTPLAYDKDRYNLFAILFGKVFNF